jgi:hypothetical protein
MRKTGEPTSTTESDLNRTARSGEGFLGRWSRRKRATAVDVQEGPAALAEAPDVQPPATAPSSADEAMNARVDSPSVVDDDAAEGSNAPLLTDADMPAIESLGDDDDYSGFMSTGVSEELRQKALRRLFRSAQFNVLDGLNDYDDDFTNFEPLGDIITSDMRHRMEEEARQAAEQLREDGISTEQDVAQAPPPERVTSSGDEQQPALDAQDKAQQVDDSVGENDVVAGEPIATGDDADAPGDAGPESRPCSEGSGASPVLTATSKE